MTLLTCSHNESETHSHVKNKAVVYLPTGVHNDNIESTGRFGRLWSLSDVDEVCIVTSRSLNHRKVI